MTCEIQYNDGATVDYNSNNLNQYTSVGEVIYSYDLNGNIYIDGECAYYYDCENQLMQAKQGANTIAEYKYDYAGKRVSKTDYTQSPARCALYVYDGDEVIADYNNAGVLQRKYIYGPGIDEPICMINVNGGETKYYYHYDGLGSVTALSNASGQLVESYHYDVYGQPDITSSVGNPYLFTGRQYDSETSLYYYRARYYKPSIGRFLQTDPVAMFLQMASTQKSAKGMLPGKYLPATALEEFLQNDPLGRFLLAHPAGRFLQTGQSGFPVELNLYTYCGNNPLTGWDPYGLGWWNWTKNAIKAIWEAIKEYSNVPDPQDMKKLHDDCKKIKHYDELHDEWIENELNEINGDPPRTNTPTGCERKQ